MNRSENRKETMNQTESKDARLEKVLRLREFERNNKAHMNAVSDIMGYPQYDVTKKSDRFGFAEQTKESVNEENIEIHPIKNQTNEVRYGFKFRLFFSFILFGVLFLDKYVFFQIPQSVYKDMIKQIEVDYSDGVIDFMKDFPYTLDYGKTGIK